MAIRLKSGSVHYDITKDVLQQSSMYFKALLETNMLECQKEEVVFDENIVSPATLSLIYNYLVVAEDCFSDMTINDVHAAVVAGSYLHLSDDFMDQCKTNLHASLTVNNCDLVLSLFSDFTELMDVCEEARVLPRKEFQQYCTTCHFYLRDVDAVYELLCDDNLNVSRELVVYTALKKWLCSHSFGNIAEQDIIGIVNKLLSCIRFPLMSDQQLTSIVSTYELQSCKKSFHGDQNGNFEVLVNTFEILLKSHVKEARRYFENELIFVSDHYLTSPRNTAEVLFTIGGFKGPRTVLQTVDMCDLSGINNSPDLSFVRHKMGELKNAVCEHCVCVVNNILYLVGGQTKYYVDGRKSTNQAFRFDPRMCEWQKLPSMEVPRSLFVLCAVGCKIYAIAGWTGPNSVTKIVEMYDIKEKKWTKVQGLARGIHEHAGCVYNGNVFVSGGFKGPINGQSNLCWKYSTCEDTWSSIAHMNEARSYHAMVACQDHILVCGGVQQIEPFGQGYFRDIQSVELYNPVSDVWSLLSTSLRYPASCMAYFVHNSHLFILGGQSFDPNRNSNDTIHKHVQIIDLEENTCFAEGELRQCSAMFFQCAKLKIQKDLIRLDHKCSGK